MMTVHEATQDMVVKPGAFIHDNDGCSVARLDRLQHVSLSAEDLKVKPDDRFAQLGAIDVRLSELNVLDDRWPKILESRATDIAHGLIVSALESRKARERALSRLAKRSRILPEDR
jgi:hypothetical protein